MEKAEVQQQLHQDFHGWRGGVEATPGVWYACHPQDIPGSKSLVSVYDLYISKVVSPVLPTTHSLVRNCISVQPSAQLRSAHCMVEQIDTHFCPHDLTNFAGHEAMKNKNRLHCFYLSGGLGVIAASGVRSTSNAPYALHI